MANFKDLTVWKLAHEVALQVYHETRRFPAEERYGLTSQVRKSAVSVPSNIAEGSARPGDRDFARFLGFARGSAAELEYQMLLAKDLEYLSLAQWDPINDRIDHVSRMLLNLRWSIEP